MSPATGRREANKQATRAALREAATRLFAEQGFEATTVAQIAHAAQVGERTFYRYFDGKEDLLAEQALAWIDLLHDTIRDRPADEPPYHAVARAMVAVAGQLSAETGPSGVSTLMEQPRPLALLRRGTPRPLRRLEAAIAAAVLDRMAEPDRTETLLRAQLLARVAAAALRTAVIQRRGQAHGALAGAGIDQLLREAFTVLADLVEPAPFGPPRDEPS